jgi:hypothetical protein
MHILSHEEGDVRYLHYGLFEREDESLLNAQERSTRFLLERLPPAPAKLLDVGSGLGTTLSTLTGLGYEAEGITPDAAQIAMIHERQGGRLRVHEARFESFRPDHSYDAIAFQESSQYIDATALFRKAAELTKHVVVLDEFSLQPLDAPGALPQWEVFVKAAEANGFGLTEELDVSSMAIPTMEYFRTRIPIYRHRLTSDLGLGESEIDQLIASGAAYRDRYSRRIYGYKVAQFRR